MAIVVIRDNYDLEVDCGFCHLGTFAAVVLFLDRLERRQETHACRGCVERMADEVALRTRAGHVS